jgi:hypothetical protein
MSTVSGRVRHYESFYSSDNGQGVGSRSDGIPNVLVYGNCQAEAVRILLASSSRSPLRTIRIPPVFELTPSDMPFLRRVAGSSQLLLSQPVSDDYHDLPLGTRQVAAMMPPGGAVVRWPVVQYSGLHPWQAIVRDPADGARNPPIVPYHDLRTLASARTGDDRHAVVPSSASILAAGEASRAELQRRELRDCDVAVSDLLQQPVLGDLSTINHPGNRILLELGRRLQQAIGYEADVVDPGRTLLGQVVAPVEDSVAHARQLTVSPVASWWVSGATVSRATIRAAQMRWYADHPAVVQAGWNRHRAAIDLLGLS